MHVSHIDYLACPFTGSPLHIKQSSEMDGEFIREGTLESSEGRVYPVRNYIPRFSDEVYARSFSVEWEQHPEILQEAISNYSAYRERFARETKWESELSGQLILEAGCGPGAFTAYPLNRGATVISFDLSSSVDQARRAVGKHKRSLFVQADILQMPFRIESFDKCFCFGVLQHVPDPYGAFLELVKMLKAGGKMAADIYIKPDRILGGGHRLLRAKYRFRKLLPDLNPRFLHFLVRCYVGITFPLYKILRDKPKGMELMRSLMVDDYRCRMTGMDEKFYKEFAVLDIFDFLSPEYDNPKTVNEFRQFFLAAGLTNVDVHVGYNGIEGRGEKPRAEW